MILIENQPIKIINEKTFGTTVYMPLLCSHADRINPTASTEMAKYILLQ